MASKDFFGEEVHVDTTLSRLCELPVDPTQFNPMITCSLQAVITVLERQYSKYFDLNVTEKLTEETSSLRTHNIDAEKIMGMFSSAKDKSPNATMCFLSCRMRACKNRTVDDLDNLEEEHREHVLRKAVKWIRFQIYLHLISMHNG